MDASLSDRDPDPNSSLRVFMHIMLVSESRPENHLRILASGSESTSDVVHGAHPLALLHEVVMREAGFDSRRPNEQCVPFSM
jgi:hypothetical protein